MMTLNHLNLSVQDVLATSDFFTTYLGFQTTTPKPNAHLAVLTGPDGFLLVLMNRTLNEKGNSTYPDSFHIGFYLPDEAAVTATYERLLQSPAILDQAPQRIRKTFGFYFTVDDIMVEITTPIQTSIPTA
ncbi:VOC family protein [Chitinophaga nivalis]|uniref:VOC family protein n=1 Tax=Chitinophaga nivalis TaxID=2991709 RepID=A0ABT3IKR8_9BACT|nr:VOC family protein [Chitinophaga nivalis]MCW3465796.1 VOC family protein [Chitinophaga nivalis]MCW3484513.1 VOC family protein [Chitinophaga nivalis]